MSTHSRLLEKCKEIGRMPGSMKHIPRNFAGSMWERKMREGGGRTIKQLFVGRCQPLKRTLRYDYPGHLTTTLGKVWF